MQSTAIPPLALGFLLAAGAACLASDPEDRAVDRLVLQLNAASAAARDSAEQSLVELGPAILPLVDAAQADAVGEAAWRLRTVQRRLEEAATAEAVEAAIDTLSVTVTGVASASGGKDARITLRAAWGPSLVPLAVRLPMQSVVADGPAGEAMPPRHRSASIEPAVTHRSAAVDLPLMLVQPEHRLESLDSLRGTLTLWIAGREHDFVLPLDGTARSLHIGQATVRLIDAEVRHDAVHVTAEVTYDAPTEALASHRSWITERLVDIEAQDGTLLRRLGQSTAARSDRGITVTASFAIEGGIRDATEGLRARWRLPLAIHVVPHDFAVRNVPLPDSR